MNFSLECFTAAFFQDFMKKFKSWLLSGRLSTCPQIQAYKEFSCNSEVVQQLVRQLVHLLSDDKI